MEYYFSLGSNIGERLLNLKRGIGYLKKHINIISLSSIYKTAPVNMAPETDYFFNMVIKAESPIDPMDMLELIKNIEKKMGRSKKTNSKNGFYDDRIIDIDILFAGDQRINTNKLTIPHKEMLNRAFVLVPLNEIAADLVYPLNNESISNSLSLVKDRGQIVKIE